MTTQEDIRRWLKEAKKAGATHLIVAVDQFDWEDYPVNVMPGEDAQEIVRTKYSGQNMQGMMEVYKLADDWEQQINMPRCFRY